MLDLDLLKSVTDANAADEERWTLADQAVDNVLNVLHTAFSDYDIWQEDIYDAIKSAYTDQPAWTRDE